MKLDECMKYMTDWYLADTIELLDLVMSDDLVAPQYSAITALNRLWLYQQYRVEMDKDYKCSDILTWLDEMYDFWDINLIRG